jgi:hypothetical protein
MLLVDERPNNGVFFSKRAELEPGKCPAVMCALDAYRMNRPSRTMISAYSRPGRSTRTLDVLVRTMMVARKQVNEVNNQKRADENHNGQHCLVIQLIPIQLFANRIGGEIRNTGS